MQNNIFLGQDPLLGGSTYSQNYDERIERLKQMQEELEKQKQLVSSSRQQVVQQQSQSPVWDEIDRITSDMSDRDFEYMSGNEEFQDSNKRIMSILQREYMRIMRPIVENTKDGKEALDNHLVLVKRLRKDASNQNDKERDLFREYTENYSDMTYKEFIEMKRNKNKNKK